MQCFDIFVLIFSLLIISVYGLLKSRVRENNSAHEVLIGSGASVWSVTLSVCSGFISSISLLGFTSEVYYQGSMMLWYAPMYCIAFPITAYVFLPIFYNLKLTTIYEYLEHRFNVQCRIIATVLFCMQILLYNSVALYAPSLAISSLTNISLNWSIILTAVLSAIYISVGGAKAGIHTSAVQMALIFSCMLSIIIASLMKTPLTEVLSSAINGSRLYLTDFRIDPRVRHSAWSLVIGGTGNVLCLFAANQLSIQRYMAMPTLKQAQRVVLLNILCNIFILSTYIFIGLLMYHFYKDCDPQINSANELLPRYIIDSLGKIPGSIGLFSAAVYSAGISTLSASFSAISAVVVKDAWIMYCSRSGKSIINEEKLLTVTRVMPIILASITIGLSMLCSHITSIILEVAFIVFGAVGGPVLGSFVVGFFMPSIKGRAACIGLLLSTIVCFSISIGSTLLKVRAVRLPVSNSCRNATIIEFDTSSFGLVSTVNSSYEFMEIFRVSYQYYSIIGVFANVFFSMFYQNVVGYKNSKTVSAELLSPLLRFEKNIAEHKIEESVLDVQSA